MNTAPITTSAGARSMPSSSHTTATTLHGAVPVTVAQGDGIGPEIMDATLLVLREAGARIETETIDVGERVYRAGNTSGIGQDAWESLRRTRVFLKAPITTPQGGGLKSLNVTIRKTLGLFANVRPCVSYFPFIRTRHPIMDVVIMRENEEDLYAGIEHRQSQDVMQCLKLISVPGTERIVRYAFEYARRNNRRKVTCFSKDNIMKLTDGLFHRIFDEVAAEYPGIENDHWIVDIGAARLADTPEQFDVIVMPNLYGDILSDVAAQITGSVGLGASANIGTDFAMFEAIHGSAPSIAGQDVANPSGLLLSSVMMLLHIGQADVAETVHNAWLRTIEQGAHTGDIFADGTSTRVVGTREFARLVTANLGRRPSILTPARYDHGGGGPIEVRLRERTDANKRLQGVDVFVAERTTADALAHRLLDVLDQLQHPGLRLEMITNRGVKVWPNGMPETFCTDHWRCRFIAADDRAMNHADISRLLAGVATAGIDFIKTENLCTFDGVPAYSLGQGQ